MVSLCSVYKFRAHTDFVLLTNLYEDEVLQRDDPAVVGGGILLLLDVHGGCHLSPGRREQVNRLCSVINEMALTS